MQTRTRHIADIAIVDIRGRIMAGEGAVVPREAVRELIDKGNKKILLDTCSEAARPAGVARASSPQPPQHRHVSRDRARRLEQPTVLNLN